MQLEKGETGGFEAMFRHGYGAPPQALDISTGNSELVFRVVSPAGELDPPGAPPVPEGSLL
jgi:hypothetical protein